MPCAWIHTNSYEANYNHGPAASTFDCKAKRDPKAHDEHWPCILNPALQALANCLMPFRQELAKTASNRGQE